MLIWSCAAAIFVGGGVALDLLRQDPTDTVFGYDAVLIALGCLCAAYSAAFGRQLPPPLLLGAPILWTGLCAIRPILAEPVLRLGLASLAGVIPIGGVAFEVRRSRGSATPKSCGRDPDTGLGDRHDFEARLTASFASAQRENAEIALIVVGIDADHVEKHRPASGTIDANTMAQGLVRVLRGALYRPVDLAYRRGEAEFAVLFPGTGMAAARIVAERVEHGLRQIITRANAEAASARISLGLAAMRPTPGDTAGSLLGRAETTRATIRLNGLPRLRPRDPAARSAASP